MKEITTREELDEVMGSARPAVIDFWGASCGPCVTMAPVYEALAEHYLDEPVDFFKVNTGVSPDVAAVFNVRSIPTFVFVLEGQVVDHNVGACDPQRLAKKVDRLLSKSRGETFFSRLLGRKSNDA